MQLAGDPRIDRIRIFRQQCGDRAITRIGCTQYDCRRLCDSKPGSVNGIGKKTDRTGPCSIQRRHPVHHAGRITAQFAAVADGELAKGYPHRLHHGPASECPRDAILHPTNAGTISFAPDARLCTCASGFGWRRCT